MNKWILIIVLILLTLAAFFGYRSGVFSSGKDQAFADYVPADTIYYMGGESDAELAELMLSYPLMPTTPSQTAQFAQLDEEITGSSPPGKFFMFFLNKILSTTDGNMSDWVEQSGVSFAGPFAIYSHGVMPVLRIKIADTEAYEGLIEEAVAESGWNYKTETIGGTDVKLWEIPTKVKDQKLYMATSLQNDVLTQTVIAESDPEKTKLERLGLAKPSKSISDIGVAKKIKKDYGFTKDLVAFVDFEKLAAGLLTSDENSFGKQIAHYFLPDESASLFDNKVTDACRKDVTSLVSNVPRLVMGYNELSVKNETLHTNMVAMLELENESIRTELGKIRGHIPSHSLDASDKIFNLGVGIKFANLTPVLTELWTKFINEDFTCEKLVAAQESAKQTNPALLSLALGMAQSVEGVGMSLYDMEWDTASNLPKAMSALVNISSTDPKTLVSLVPTLLGGVQIPDDGSVADIPVPVLPPSIQVKATVKGNNIVIFSGDVDADLAKLESESLESNGLFSMGINYRKFKDFGELNFGSVGLDAEGCIAQQEFVHIMNQMAMDSTWLFDVTEKGLENTVVGSIDVTQEKPLNLVGDFKLEYLNESCEWEYTGVDKLKSDGTGEYQEKDEAGQCLLYDTQYTWQKQGNLIVMKPTKEQWRDTCEEELTTGELEEYSCHIMNVEEDTFQCLFDAGTEDAFLYRYKAI